MLLSWRRGLRLDYVSRVKINFGIVVLSSTSASVECDTGGGDRMALSRKWQEVIRWAESSFCCWLWFRSNYINYSKRFALSRWTKVSMICRSVSSIHPFRGQRNIYNQQVALVNRTLSQSAKNKKSPPFQSGRSHDLLSRCSTTISVDLGHHLVGIFQNLTAPSSFIAFLRYSLSRNGTSLLSDFFTDLINHHVSVIHPLSIWFISNDAAMEFFHRRILSHGSIDSVKRFFIIRKYTPVIRHRLQHWAVLVIASLSAHWTPRPIFRFKSAWWSVMIENNRNLYVLWRCKEQT